MSLILTSSRIKKVRVHKHSKFVVVEFEKYLELYLSYNQIYKMVEAIEEEEKEK